MRGNGYAAEGLWLFEMKRQDGLSAGMLERWWWRLCLFAFDGVGRAAVVVSWIVAASVRMPLGSGGLFAVRTAKKNKIVQRVCGCAARGWINRSIFGAGEWPAWV